MLANIIILALLSAHTLGDNDLEKIFKDTQIEFENGVLVGDGLEFKPGETLSVPTIDWPSADPAKLYAIYMGCPDAPDEKDPRWREALHWLVVNIPGNQIDKGEVFCPYLGPVPPKSGGMMRYVYLVYEQPNKMAFDEKVLNATDWDSRVNYRIKKFAEKYKLGQPLAGNIYRSQWDESVPLMHKRLGITVDN